MVYAVSVAATKADVVSLFSEIHVTRMFFTALSLLGVHLARRHSHPGLTLMLVHLPVYQIGPSPANSL